MRGQSRDVEVDINSPYANWFTKMNSFLEPNETMNEESDYVSIVLPICC